ncbi:tRNA threonylcarbamoyl adenosine modification protein, Sua5/YciO/YrdC/YwlC family [Actinobaculum suis]|uniref:L-threonylcarbamoyladenylate synthase n=1 Tax=Actinobaculum suis TaxID=1657 RepID=A0A0K9ESR0_9ACTO|nr:L-threonylcarbamoyladenylate synthase [Actinobaculum suis]KMY22901.1 translation factor Sua5 [Actinobaculum suis]MDY5153821.1 L-threonylcarbamoyladenylate synthase [Actinobaculum suis]OCA93951.1 threonylcarbamoyl-AMP synthase [Actinobaculum suis]OCA94416.1 threonylcarbamoyl-AMP synthase [Actinobaculum suis]SDE29631.1 tRNA threonylcarbamoyl adenosine modification protein, Sua5/YciO/YrdC/YwlC family [Actinobaculum suis]
MATFIEIHPDNPQARNVAKVVDVLREDGIAAIPTDSGYALISRMANKSGLERIRTIRKVGEKHDFTMLCRNFAQLGTLVIVSNPDFRLIKQLTPGPYTFILKGTKEVPNATLNKKKKTVGVRIPDHKITQAIVEANEEPVLSSTLILPGEEEPLTTGEEVEEKLGQAVDIIVDGPVGGGATTVLDLVTREVRREGAGDITGIEL